jgi:2,3-bisphosphoglycerate-independent phosphoglycerate mutase
VRALENWDRLILADLVRGLDRLGAWRLLLLPDHATPLARRTHTADPVPYLLADSRQPLGSGEYSERGVRASTAVPGHSLMARLVG